MNQTNQQQSLWLPGFEPALSPAPVRRVRLSRKLSEDVQAPASTESHEGEGQKAVAEPQASALTRSSAATTQQAIERRNFVLRPEIVNAQPTQQAKFAANMAAIECLFAIESTKRMPNEEERGSLARYSGWGAVPQAFEVEHPVWGDSAKRLKALLRTEDWHSARASTPNAHYTPYEVISAIYDALKRFGFNGGRVLDPSAGTGHFSGAMPADLAVACETTSVECDRLSARIGALLYPDNNWHACGLEQASLPDDYFDLAVGNIPFGDYQLADPAFDQLHLRVHDYFFAKALTKVRPGGLVVFITSTGTMDKLNESVRAYLARRARLLGAIRLPSRTFQVVANTHVATDVLFLQRRSADELSLEESGWLSSRPADGDENSELWLNQYFIEHPKQVIGTVALGKGSYGRRELVVQYKDDLGRGLRKAIEALPEGCYRCPQPVVQAAVPRKRLPAPAHIKPGAFTLCEGELGVREGDEVVIVEHSLPDSTVTRIKAMLAVRFALRSAIHLQATDAPAADIDAALGDLNACYDNFVAKFGCLHERRNRQAFRSDPDLPLLLSVEHYDPDAGIASKAAIFTQRTIFAHRTPTSAGSTKEALAISLCERGRLDLPWMAQLCARPVDEIVAELAESGGIFLDPQTQVWVTKEEYCSGNVRQKLKVAKTASCSVGGRMLYARNIRALQAAVPPDLGPGEISARLGSPWLPTGVIEAFLAEIFKGIAKARTLFQVFYNTATSLWSITVDERERYDVRRSVENNTTFGTGRVDALELLELALNQKQPKVYDLIEVDGEKKQVANVVETEAAREKQGLLHEEFKRWLWSDPDRAVQLTTLYNDRFNAFRPREYDGSHLTFQGMSYAVTPYPSQRSVVWQGLHGNTLLAHCVGAGKTFAMVATTMEMRRLGLAHKPMHVVLNHQLEDYAAEFLRFYPSANLLVASKDDFDGAKRRQLIARIATGDWDAVILTQSSFERIVVPFSYSRAFIDAELDKAQAAIVEASVAGSRRAVKQLESAKKRLYARLKRLSATEKKDTHISFDELGVDALFIDEAHYFKNLFFHTKMGTIAGLPNSSSQRAFDMYMKCLFVQDKRGREAGVIFATGTPVSNTMAELYTMQRYLQPQTLETLGLAHFDAWAGMFGEVVAGIEVAPDGQSYRMHRRFARFVNLPELTSVFAQVADIRTQEDLKLPVPRIFGGKAQTISAKISAAQQAFVDALVDRAEEIRLRLVHPKEDNMLAVTTDGRKAALDFRLIDPKAQDFSESKVHLALEKIFEIWRNYAATRATQIVFCDLSAPKYGKGFSVYEFMRDELVARGVPDGEIAFIHDADTDSAKASMFQRMRRGTVRILFGSTPKLGVGTNVQRLLLAEHHLDAPWRPSDIEQRDGRALRPGNEHAEVMLFRYVTERSFDSYMWQTLETKARFIAQVMRRDAAVRTIEDAELHALSYAEVKALATGNPQVIEKAGVDAEVARLSRLKAAWRNNSYALQTRAVSEQERIARKSKEIAALEEDIARRKPTRGDAFSIIVDGKQYRDREVAGLELARLFEQGRQHFLNNRTAADVAIGEIGGFEIILGTFWLGVGLALRGAQRYQARAFTTPRGAVQVLENCLSDLDSDLEEAKHALAYSERNLQQSLEALSAPFEHEARLQDRLKRQREINAALGIGVDEVGASSLDHSEADEELAA